MDPWTHSQNILKETKEGCNFCNEEYKKSTAQDTFGRIETVPGGFIKIACSWSSLVEGDEQPDSPNGQICVECCIVYAEQCDQMLKYKVATKLPKKLLQQLKHEYGCFQKSPKTQHTFGLLL